MYNTLAICKKKLTTSYIGIDIKENSFENKKYMPATVLFEDRST